MNIHLKGELVDGIEVATVIRAGLQVPVVYVPASVDDETVQRAMDTFPEGYLIKSFGEHDLKAVVKLALGNRPPRIRLPVSPVERTGG